MTLLVCLFSIATLLCLAASFPIRIDFESTSAVLYVRWLFLSSAIRLSKGPDRIATAVFGRSLGTGKKAKRPNDSSPDEFPPKKRKRKTLRKVTPGLACELTTHPAVLKALGKLVRFLLRSLQAVEIKRIEWELGLKDYFLQGIVHGATAHLAQSGRVRVHCNYRERNRFELRLHVSVWRLLHAALLLLCGFPYWRVYRLYRSLLSAY